MRARARHRLDPSTTEPASRTRIAPSRRSAGTLATDGALARAQQLGHRIDRLAVSSRPTPGAIQRTVEPSGPPTENGAYLVGKGGSVLYSRLQADDPVPVGLYQRRNEKTTSGTQYYEWTPNVRFLRSNESGESIDIGALTREIEEPTGRTGDILPTLGIVGKNDCSNFATALQALIYESGAVRSRNRDTLPIESLAQERDELVVSVGDMMKHYFQSDDELSCHYHAATVVARDGADVVTLEGHVSRDLGAPEFHIRHGLAGFVGDNNRSRDYGDKVSLVPAEVNQLAEKFFGYYEILKGNEFSNRDKLTILERSLAMTKDVKGKIKKSTSSSILPIAFLVLVIAVLLARIFNLIGPILGRF